MFPLKIKELSATTTSLRKQKNYHLSYVFLILLNLLTGAQLKATGELSEYQELDDSEYSWDIATDNPALYSMIPMLDLDSIFEELEEAELNAKYISQPQTRPRRSKRYSPAYHDLNYERAVYEKVGATKTQNNPFSSAVRISKKCTGTLISRRHVLTAAHCVHDGKRLKYKLPSLKVEFLQRNGRFHKIKVTKIFVPDGWKIGKMNKKRHFSDRLPFDFAVLRLKRPHRRSYFHPQNSNLDKKLRMKFNGFPSNKGGTMWHSSCRVSMAKGQILFSRCNASKGSSGSGIYASKSRGGYKVTGIVSASGAVTFGSKAKKHKMFLTFATKFTPAKVKLICHWVGPGTKCRI